MATINYDEKIPNNVNLSEDARLQRALERWQPKFLDWWKELGPVGSSDYDVYLRTAVSVEPSGWAHFDYVKMPEYRWGIFLAPQEEDRKINFGAHKGEPAWQTVPGEYRSELRRLIVTQGDTEPASVEQQRRLGQTAPSLYDLRNLYQVNVEEGRHLWAMVYLLQAHFGRDGREEAEALLERHAGDADKPRILQAFNEKTDDWLSFHFFTYFQDRDGKFQLAALAESGFDPLSRSCRFMLTEEAHHLFVGESGISRIIQRSAEIMKENNLSDPYDVRKHGGIDLPTIQKWLNFHFSICLDLFGQELSTNAATYYTMGLKGRYEETKIDDDHVLDHASYKVPEIRDGKIIDVEEPALNAINQRLRDEYYTDSQRGVDNWNKIIADNGIDFELVLPDRAFHRNIGPFAEVRATPEGKLITQAEWDKRHGEWLPTKEDREFVESLMKPVTEPGKFANYIAPPARGINRQPVDFEYVKFH
ncbi:MAG TPA: benzoyl-CoA 2,3-epoxidase subunit BoxB [Alphaproteobacteria bacterium]|nr:benzoyl-CoA 2,3-epoxidase subunit BoxB [Alphaproteobacteria bacterium]